MSDIRRELAVALAVGVLTCPAPALAGNPHQNVSVRLDRNVNFGRVAGSWVPGLILLDTDGDTRCTPGLQCLGGANAGQFSITGAKDEIVQIDIGPAILRNANNATMLALLRPSLSTMVLRPGNARNTFTVGGTLVIGLAQGEGTYQGNYTVTVEYE